ncbi:MAG: hypothetical protein Q9M91_05545 [Candidatus Dojkabacteria bacterium]|nr:hypothetical protein [Candidatus Dojkabacteria bacterium]
MITTDLNGDVKQYLLDSRISRSGEWTDLGGRYAFDNTEYQDVSISIDTSFFEVNSDIFLKLGIDDIRISETDYIDWEVITDALIDQNRKGNFNLEFINEDGSNLVGADISIEQVENDFKFGTISPALNGGNTISTNQAYYDYIAENYNAFNEIVNFKFDIIYRENYPNGDNPNISIGRESKLKFTEDEDMYVFGQVLFNGALVVNNDWISNLSDQEIKDKYEDYLTSLLPELNGRVENLVTTIHVTRNAHAGFIDRFGEDFYDYMYGRPQEIAPDIQYIISDSGTLGGRSNIDDHLNVTDYLVNDRNLRADGIAFQAHFPDEYIVNPLTTIDRFDEVNRRVSLPIWITEFDTVMENIDLRAENVRRFYKIAFSRKDVNGIFNWGFTPNQQWRGINTTWVDENFNENAAGEAYLSLREEWTTNINTAVTDTNGQYSFRGFYGQYKINITLSDGSVVTKYFNVPENRGSAKY